MMSIHVTVAWAAADAQEEIEIDLAAPATIANAISAAQSIRPELRKIAESAVAVGVWGKVRPPDFALRDGDRVELYRPLKADPKVARRDNARRQSAKIDRG